MTRSSRLVGRLADQWLQQLAVEDLEVELTEPLRVGEDVDLDDLPASDRDRPDGERLSLEGRER
jgi:hypothetical protein